MSRVIKFRAWDDQRKRMVAPYTNNPPKGIPKKHWFVGLNGDGLEVSEYVGKGLWWKYKVMQYTGVKDEELTEIFEEDHLWAKNNTGELEYVGRVIWDFQDARFEVVSLHGRFEYIPDGCVVRGNNYEPREVSP